MSPHVSVVIPTYNRRVFLEEAVGSCLAGNDAIDVEVVVVDDGSTDGTRDYLESLANRDPRVRSIFQEHQGAQVARNRGLAEARGQTVKFLDDDDYLLPGALRKQYETLEASDADLCYGDFFFVSEEDGSTQRFTNGRFRSFFSGLALTGVQRLPLIHLFTRSAVEGIQWDESLNYMQDVAFMLEAASRHLTCRKLEAPVAVHRIHREDRISDARQQAHVTHRLKKRCQLYWQAYQKLSENGPLDEALRNAAATGLWHEAHKLAGFSLMEFDEWYGKIRCVQPGFLPPRPNRGLAALDRLLSPRYTELLIYPLRKAKARLT
jgi:glycosyltransferase involved in cell wall biosynthesis